ARDLKHVSLELGGKSPNIILEDADLDVAIPGAASAIFFNHGQCCSAGSRLYVHERLFDKVVAGVSDQAKAIKLGSGLDPATQMGPMVSETQRDRVCSYLELGKKEGARAVHGGRAREGRGGSRQLSGHQGGDDQSVDLLAQRKVDPARGGVCFYGVAPTDAGRILIVLLLEA